MPIVEHGFNLHKRAVRDTPYIEYGWQLNNFPSLRVCKNNFTIEHACYDLP